LILDSTDATEGNRDKMPTGAPRLDPDRWLNEHGDVLFRFAKTRVGRSDMAEDLVQETLLAALRGQQQFRGEADERTWLLAILKRKIIDQLRRKGRESSFTSIDKPDEWINDLFDQRERWRVAPGNWERGPGAAMERAEFWGVFSLCLGKLPRRMAEVFSQREIDQLHAEEICKDLAITPTNLWVILYRARLRLWKCLDANWFGGEREE